MTKKTRQKCEDVKIVSPTSNIEVGPFILNGLYIQFRLSNI